MSTPLDDYPQARKIVYHLYWVVGVILVCIQAYFVAVGASTPAGIHIPTWLVGANAVYGALGIGIGLTAASNTPSQLTDAASQAQKAMASIQDAKNKIAPIASGAIDGKQTEDKS